MEGQLDTGLLGNWKNLIQKRGKALPDRLRRDWPNRTHWIGRIILRGIVDHVPDHSVRNRRLRRVLIAHRHSTTTRERSGGTTPDTGNAEVIAHHRNTNPAHITDDALEMFQLLSA